MYLISKVEDKYPTDELPGLWSLSGQNSNHLRHLSIRNINIKYFLFYRLTSIAGICHEYYAVYFWLRKPLRTIYI